MMSVLNVNALKMSFIEHLLFSDASFEIQNTDKVGLIGANGSGKTTLFKLICSQLQPTEGGLFLSRSAKIGFVEQHTCTDMSVNAYEETLKIFAPLIEAENELEALPAMIEKAGAAEREGLIHRHSQLLEAFHNEGGLTYKSRARSMLLGLGFSENEINLNISALSGGQKTKLALGKLLLSDANFILLDEPTNHLDIKSVEWLEDFLSKYSGAAIIISHDRYFLDKVTNKTMQITNKKIYVTKGNYSTFMKIRAEQRLSEQRKYENDRKEIERIEGIIEQQKRFNRERNYITIASKEKQIERIKADMVIPDTDEKQIRIRFNIRNESGNEVIIAENLTKSFEGKPLFKNVTFTLRKGEKAFLIGPNGCGKTTLLKIIMRKILQDGGLCRFGASVRPSYFEQSQQSIVSDKTVIDECLERCVSYTVAELRNYLAAFLFRGEEIYKKMDKLSGGERSRVALLEIALTGSNLLILDEPSNHLDIASREVLEEALAAYEGTILCVSHDRYLINRLATKIYAFSGGGIEPFEGNYDEYISALSIPEAARDKKEKAPNDYQRRKEQESLERKRLSRIARIEEEIAQLDAKKEEINLELQKEETLCDHEKLLLLTEELEQLTVKEDLLYKEWESSI